MQENLASRRELCCIATVDKVRLAAERIDPSEYREVAIALVAMDVPVGQVSRLAHAILVVRGEECHRHFLGEYGDLVWDSLRQQVTQVSGRAA